MARFDLLDEYSSVVVPPRSARRQKNDEEPQIESPVRRHTLPMWSLPIAFLVVALALGFYSDL